jgi:hypothetical protein
MIIQFSGIIDSIHSKKDRTLSVRLGTQELSSEETAKIFDHQGHLIWVAIAEGSMATEDLNIPEVLEDTDKKTPSQRLRDRLAAYYKHHKGNFENFNTWYINEMNKIGQTYLDKLEK